MKQKVIEFFQNLPEAPYEQFNKAFELYRQSDGKNIAIERVINATGYTPSGLQNLLYDLQKMHGITDVEKVPQVGSLKLEVGSEGDGVLQLDPNSEIPGTLEETTDLDSLKEKMKNLECERDDLQYEKEELESENENLQDENEDLKTEVETLKLAPKLDAKAIRVEFPFLNEKDCPDEFKILVADKITAWNEYLETQERIQNFDEKISGKEEMAELAKKAIEDFDENQKIYDELNCYQTTGKVLGVHPIFKKLQLTREVETMTSEELVKYKSSSAKYFTDNRKSLAKAEKAKDEARILEINTRVVDRELKLALVNKRLGIPVK
jgi:cell division protein FtsL